MDYDITTVREFRKEIEEKVNNELDTEISTLNNSLGIDFLHSEEINNSYFSVAENNFHNKYDTVKSSQGSEEQGVWSNFNNLDVDHFELLMENLSSTSIIVKLKDLEKLLNIQVIDTKREYWQQLSKLLLQCLLNANNEIFLRALKVHYKIIAFPPTSFDGYINILKGGLILLKSTDILANGKQDIFHVRAVKVLQLVLEMQQHVLQSILHLKPNVIIELITLFLYFLNYRLASSNYKNMIEFVCIFDKHADWFSLFCFGSSIRKIFINLLLDNVDFLKFVMDNFYKTLNNRDFADEDTIQYFFHNVRFITYLINHKENWKYFPLTLKLSERIKIPDLLELMVLRINDKRLNNEIKKLLKDSVTLIYCTNPNLLTNYVLSILVEPFRSCDNNIAIKNVQENMHIIDIINSVSKSDINVLFKNLNKFHKPRMKRYQMKLGGVSFRERLNCPQVIIDYAVFLLNIYIKHNEEINDIDHETLVVLNTCKLIYKNNPISSYYINSTKLLISLKNTYQILYSHGNNHNKHVLELFILCFEYFSQIFEILDDETLLQKIFDDIFLFFEVKELINLLCNVSSSNIGYDKAKNSHNCVIKAQLEKIWHVQENDDLFSPDLVQEEIGQFITNMFLLKCSYKLTHALLAFENDNTVVSEEAEFCTILSDLLEKCLESCEDNIGNYVGLLLLRIFITNLDLQLYLISNYKIQEKLLGIQEICSSTEYNNSPIIIDKCSVLRHNILMSIKHTGYVVDTLHDNILNQTQLLIGTSNPSPTMKFFNNVPNEFRDFLINSETVSHDNSWFLQARKIFKSSCNENQDISLFPILIKQIPKIYVYRKSDLTWPQPDSVYYQLFPEDFTGISLIISYGCKAELLSSSELHEDNLNLLIKQARIFISHQPENFQNFDWFVGIIFLINGGDFEKSKTTLLNVINTQVTSLVWSTFAFEFDFTMQDNFYQQFNIILQEIEPVAYSALIMLGISPIIVAKNWLRQSFFNILELEEICNFLIAAVLYPPDFTLFYLIAIFCHIKTPLCTCTHTQNIENILKLVQIGSFKLTNYFEYIENLMKQYKSVIKF